MTIPCLMVAGALRSRAYLQMLERHGLRPPAVLLLQPRGRGPLPVSLSPKNCDELERLLGMSAVFDPEEDEAVTCERLDVAPIRLPTGDINDPRVIVAAAALPGSSVLVSPPGRLNESLLACGKRFLHLHPGELPRYRGSTTFYYSLLEESTLACSAFFMSARFDAGPLVHHKKITAVNTTLDIDALLDPLLRAVTLVECLQTNPAFKPLPEPVGEDNEFFVIHPVLKHRALLKIQGRA